VTATVANWTVTVAAPGADADCEAAIAAMIEGERALGRTAVVVSLDGRPVGVLALADRVRPEAAQAIADLTAASRREPVLLTGDNPRAAAALATQVGLTDVRAGLLPEDKVTAVRDLQRDGQRVLLVGDGVNDAPALAAAVVRLSRRARRLVVQNLIIAATVIAVLVTGGPRGRPPAAARRRRARGVDHPGGAQRAATAAPRGMEARNRSMSPG
jgi:cation-transporting P-type ATPase J